MKKNKKNEENIDYDFNEDEVLYQDEPSISVSYFEDSHHKEEEINLIGQFELIKLAPIKLQMQLNCCCEENEYESFKSKVNELWNKIDIQNIEFEEARNETLNLSNKLIDCIAYNNLNNLLALTIIITSMCLGWILSAGVYYWKKNVLGPNFYNYYKRCNILSNFTYPPFGTY